MLTLAKKALHSLIAACAITAVSAHAEDFSDWYQIEVIVFANKSPIVTDEIWPLEPLRYPHDMVAIAPQTPDQLGPYSLQQVNDIERYLAMFDATLEARPETDGFLFESRRRFQMPTATDRAPVVEPDTSGTETSGAIDEPLIDWAQLFEQQAPEAFKALPDNERMLNSLARSVRRSSIYELLLHQSWLQPVSVDDRAVPVMLQAGDHFDSTFELDGTIRVNRSRFLHVETDLWFTEFAPLYQSGEVYSADESMPGRNVNTVTAEIRQRYPEVAEWEATRGQYVPVHSHQLRQSRRMRSSTLHFIDHPRFGVLIKIEGFDGLGAD